jgi:hypothetical protein
VDGITQSVAPDVPPWLLTFSGFSRHSCIPMKKFLLSLLILAGLTPAMFAELPFMQDSYQQALKLAKQRKQPLFVECWAPW